MAEVVYVLCAATSAFCAVMLLRSYRVQRSRLLLLSMSCFVGLALNSLLLPIDLLALPDIDLRLLRTSIAYVSILAFLLGLIWEAR